MGGHGIITITGELTTKAYVDIRKIVQGIVGDKYGVQVNIVQQSPEIAQGVNTGGAGDQGIMVGYACDETPELMPKEVILARSLCQYIYSLYPYDGKTQITILDGKIIAVVASFQCISKEELEAAFAEWATRYPYETAGQNITAHFNAAGDWSTGGFEADTGLTGRKLIVDNYGPRIPIGGGAFSGKDATKVDRSAAYMARRLAVDLLRDNTAKEVYVYLAYAIGVVNPVQATAIVDGVEIDITQTAKKDVDLTPAEIIALLDLKKPQFAKTAEWGHFGNGFTWER
jgi:S-adenosylmethionine synthetase